MKKIGIFDSGVGGLSVAKHIFNILPEYDTVYFGDTARVPYGGKSEKVIQKYALEDADFLISKNAGIIVIGCNTASAVALKELRNKFEIPIIDVVFPGAEEAAQVTKNGKVGIIGTAATIRSGIHKKYLQEIDNSLNVFSKACPLLVSLAEENCLSEKLVEDILREYLSDLVSSGIDTLILGCTHFPYFYDQIKRIYPQLNLVDPGRRVAENIKDIVGNNLELKNSLGRMKKREFFVSDISQNIKKTCKKFLDPVYKVSFVAEIPQFSTKILKNEEE